MGSTRNGARPKAPPEGERGATGASSYLGDSLFAYGKRRAPSNVELHQMFSFDPWAEAIEGALTWPIRSAKWSIKEAEGDRGEAEAAREQFTPLATRSIAGALSAVGRRIAFAELVWSVSRNAGVVLEDLAFRPIDQCVAVPDANGRPSGFRQTAYAVGRGMVNEEFLASDYKAFVFVHNEAGRPGVGRSALESAYQHYEDKQKLFFYRYKSLEKYGGPSTHGKTNAPAGSDARNSFENAVRDARSGASIVTDMESEINYLNPPNAGDAFQKAIRDLNFEMAVSGFVQFLALAQEGNSGAYALSRDHSDFLTIVTEGRMAELAAAFTSGPIRDTTFLNFGPGAAFPVFEFEPLSEHQIKRMHEAGNRLFSATGREMPDWLAERIAEGYGKSLGLEKPEDADPVGPPRRVNVPTQDSNGGNTADEQR